MERLAAYNFALFVAPFDKPETDEFRRRNLLSSERLNGQGFIGRSGYDGEEGPPSWGQTLPALHGRQWLLVGTVHALSLVRHRVIDDFHLLASMPMR
ncbi:hypothetical protein ABID21_003178 [Pseudorhizobium tarimense]|uniref:Uncharacterized protein n=1 Tax=Pseudorhizobium tarimense TaxID=1079109 RepID=A0ABV2H953_9HYPH|nr:hypothetical protein [Pseudorhizobium tarimense]MCJ8520308.1 hypothetical protein [Pseudorhizobium tarimense]